MLFYSNKGRELEKKTEINEENLKKTEVKEESCLPDRLRLSVSR